MFHFKTVSTPIFIICQVLYHRLDKYPILLSVKNQQKTTFKVPLFDTKGRKRDSKDLSTCAHITSKEEFDHIWFSFITAAVTQVSCNRAPRIRWLETTPRTSDSENLGRATQPALVTSSQGTVLAPGPHIGTTALHLMPRLSSYFPVCAPQQGWD